MRTAAYATIDDAIRSALQIIDPYAKEGYTVHEEDEWGGDLGVNERKAIRHMLLKGTDYWFCLGADLDSAGKAWWARKRKAENIVKGFGR